MSPRTHIGTDFVRQYKQIIKSYIAMKKLEGLLVAIVGVVYFAPAFILGFLAIV